MSAFNSRTAGSERADLLVACDGLESAVGHRAQRGHGTRARELGAAPIDYQRENSTRLLPDGFDVIIDGTPIRRSRCCRCAAVL
jgi:hypothetical protein